MFPLLAPAAVGLGKLGAGLAIGTGITGGVTAGLNAIPTFKETFGQTNEAQAKNELYNRTALPGEKINRDGLEKFMDFFTGRDAGEIERLALERDNANIKQTIAANYDVDKIRRNINKLQLSQDLLPKLDNDQSKASYEKELNSAKNAIQAAKMAKSKYGDIDLKGLDEIEIAAKVAQRDQGERSRIEGKADQKYSDAMVMALMNQEASNRRADNQFNLQMSQQDYNNRVLEQTDRRNSRKDQREMLMLLMAGLDNIGKLTV